MLDELFKAKSIADGEWITGYLYRISESQNPFIMPPDSKGTSYEVDPSTVCRCTRKEYMDPEIAEVKEMDNRMNIQSQVNCMKDAIVGFKYKHFKGGIYEVTDIAVHSEKEEPMVIYKSFDNPNLVWCRPLDMFMSEVDHEKYPNIQQKMRFERIGKDE